MTLRNELIAFTEVLWTEADEAAARRSRHIAAAKREVANRMRVILRVPEIIPSANGENGHGPEE